ncbi:F0F1 ATP synthase subunit A [Natronogracilivirga saccharolytica]|uniref:ATP synthase subunit a n=1 Tax=Natronogracilivirga saccharolytica TaxID=2812953 RepID=A0A8J7UWL6_9BACT|nr:F0F1 ATP synthase subunit A [Natronogracilivirga saccharolytica]MBP3192369.1 F0F1 ATP synthase subunit A [Natronogracilivirga saccharolytica]
MKHQLRLLFLIIVFIAGTAAQSSAESSEENDIDLVEEGAGESAENRIDLIDKVVDHHYLDFKPLVTIELPRFFYDDGSFHFHRSTTALLNSKPDLFTDEDYIDADPVTKNGEIQPASWNIVRTDGTPVDFDFSITSHLVFFWIAALLTFAIFIPLSKKYRQGVGRSSEPKGAFQNIFETLVLFIRDDIALQNIGSKKYQLFTPYLLTVFFFILFMNFFGLMPWGVSSTADITVTAVLAICTFFATQLFASKEHWKHIFWFPGVPVPIKFILLPVELIGLFTKPFALCIRLFANMASGKILIFALLGTIFLFSDLFGPGIAYGTSWVWVFLTLFVYLIKALVSFIQAYVFTILSALFIGLAVDDHSEEHAH